MRRIFTQLFAAVAFTPLPAYADWEWSSFPGEERKSVIGCSDSETDDSWLCLAARCDATGQINLYIELTNLDVEDALDIVVGDSRFTVVGTSETDAPYSSRLDGSTGEILAALKAGSAAVLDRPQYPFTAGYDTIPLRGSSRAISALEQACGAPRAVQPGAGPIHDALLPLDLGIYVREGTPCEELTHATTLRYTGDHLNAQRVEGRITSVEAEGTVHHVSISARDIAEDEDLGDLDWTLIITPPREFALEAGTEADRYRWCFETMPSGAAIS